MPSYEARTHPRTPTGEPGAPHQLPWEAPLLDALCAAPPPLPTSAPPASPHGSNASHPPQQPPGGARGLRAGREGRDGREGREGRRSDSGGGDVVGAALAQGGAVAAAGPGACVMAGALYPQAIGLVSVCVCVQLLVLAVCIRFFLPLALRGAPGACVMAGAL